MLIYFDLFISFALSFTIAFLLIPKIIHVSIAKKLFDVPNHRSAAKHVVPTLGGIAIFAGFRIAQVISLDNFNVNELKYLSISIIAMLFVGLMDDLVGLPAKSKFIIQLVMAVYLVVLGHFRITNFHGILGIHEISFITGTFFSVIAIVGIINAVNLIDGIDGLASGIGILVSLVYGTWFFKEADYIYAFTCFSLVGSLIAFSLYNVFGTTNKIFMGDTGSLILGTIFAILTLHFNEFNPSENGSHGLPAISLAIIIVPVIDTTRIFVIRIWQGKSPFTPDMNHIHHQILRLTGSHLYSSLLIIAVNAMFILLSFSLVNTFGNNHMFFVLLVLGFILAGIPSWILKVQNKNSGTKPENRPIIQYLPFSTKEIKKQRR
jgi:UDP-N-acetylmuramyl pentapeptide phosphotransferase/UDP-N-acetylglucosamine-1-phosphate transferase